MPPKKSKRRNQPLKLKPVAVNCPFCKEAKDPDYKKYTEIARYLTERAKIMPKSRTGLCAKHQRRLAISIKRARHLALLPFTGSL
ncbi:30S ribosomal protein S18 [Candidatus Woesebacteria bacterium RIFOXYD1_FULL_40_21]|uniref:Small ribosomal subunit protein bS18 n=1 Tax=Candidatus Woesebacteria bacterium RIFOXYD1_FULL_40_21 TaxID=1802549 RepID=A0A1F8DH94_9BACT|nr:MAG: 30S ribosomal protein S18 [Candidatus Woesebacteria bacterium RIFOXYD1_FULL_40_21]